MIATKQFLNVDGKTKRFLSEFVIASDQHAKVYVHTLDAPTSSDLVSVAAYDMVDNSIVFYEAPAAGSIVTIEVATNMEEFGDNVALPAVDRAENAANAAEEYALAALAYRNQAQTFSISAEGYKNECYDYSLVCKAYKDQTETYKNSAQIAASQALLYSNSANTSYLNISALYETFTDEATGAMAKATLALSNSVTATANAQTAVNIANYAITKANTAKTLADESKITASDAYNLSLLATDSISVIAPLIDILTTSVTSLNTFKTTTESNLAIITSDLENVISDVEYINLSKPGCFVTLDAPQLTGNTVKVGDLWIQSDNFTLRFLKQITYGSGGVPTGYDWKTVIAKIYYSAEAPDTTATGAIWIDSDSMFTYIYNGSNWVIVNDNKRQIYYSILPPESPNTGMLWCSSENQKLYVFNGSIWESTGGNKNYISLGTSGYPLDATIGSIWVDSTTNYSYMFDGVSWVAITNETADQAHELATTATTTAENAQTIALDAILTATNAQDSADAALTAVSNKNKIFVQTSTPTATSTGDLWFDTDDNNKPYFWNGTSWVSGLYDYSSLTFYANQFATYPSTGITYPYSKILDNTISLYKDSVTYSGLQTDSGTILGLVLSYNGTNGLTINTSGARLLQNTLSLAQYSTSVATYIGNFMLYSNKFQYNADNYASLGSSTNRWSTVYAGTGTINTSDERMKQDIRDLTEVEKTTALTIKSKLKAYRFKDSVAEKGDNARIHFGVLAQEVKNIFEINGLNGFNYGVLCYDSWETIPAEFSNDGELLREEVVAGDRYGIRYDELFAFIIAAL